MQGSIFRNALSAGILPTFFVVLMGCANQQDFKVNKKLEHLIGSNLPDIPLLDSLAANSKIDYKSFDFTIVEFWFSECPGCLIEMKQFNTLLNKSDKKVQIASVSINSFFHWKSLYTSTKKTFDFLKTETPGWVHYALRSEEDPRLKNDIPSDNIHYIKSNFKTHAFPVYLVINKSGKVIATPESAVEYINAIVD